MLTHKRTTRDIYMLLLTYDVMCAFNSSSTNRNMVTQLAASKSMAECYSFPPNGHIPLFSNNVLMQPCEKNNIYIIIRTPQSCLYTMCCVRQNCTFRFHIYSRIKSYQIRSSTLFRIICSGHSATVHITLNNTQIAHLNKNAFKK